MRSYYYRRQSTHFYTFLVEAVDTCQLLEIPHVTSWGSSGTNHTNCRYPN